MAMFEIFRQQEWMRTGMSVRLQQINVRRIAGWQEKSTKGSTLQPTSLSLRSLNTSRMQVHFPNRNHALAPSRKNRIIRTRTTTIPSPRIRPSRVGRIKRLRTRMDQKERQTINKQSKKKRRRWVGSRKCESRHLAVRRGHV